MDPSHIIIELCYKWPLKKSNLQFHQSGFQLVRIPTNRHPPLRTTNKKNKKKMKRNPCKLQTFFSSFYCLSSLLHCCYHDLMFVWVKKQKKKARAVAIEKKYIIRIDYVMIFSLMPYFSLFSMKYSHTAMSKFIMARILQMRMVG